MIWTLFLLKVLTQPTSLRICSNCKSLNKYIFFWNHSSDLIYYTFPPKPGIMSSLELRLQETRPNLKPDCRCQIGPPLELPLHPGVWPPLPPPWHNRNQLTYSMCYKMTSMPCNWLLSLWLCSADGSDGTDGPGWRPFGVPLNCGWSGNCVSPLHAAPLQSPASEHVGNHIMCHLIIKLNIDSDNDDNGHGDKK